MTTLLIVLAVSAAAFVSAGWFAWFSPWARAERELHDARWAGYVDVEHDGLTNLQRECERRLVEELSSRGFLLQNRRVQPFIGSDGESFIAAEVSELDAEFWLYPNQTDISTPKKNLRLEEWDTDTPEEHLEAVISFVNSIHAAGAPNASQ